MNIIVFHGWGASENDNWFPWVKELFEPKGIQVTIPHFPNTENPKLEQWLQTFENYLKEINDETILIGHSLGGPFILSLLERINKRVKTTILVSPFCRTLKDPYANMLVGTFINKDFNWDKIKENGHEFHVLYSDNDTYVPINESIFVAEKTNATLHLFKGMDHFLFFRGYPKFQQLLFDIIK